MIKGIFIGIILILCVIISGCTNTTPSQNYASYHPTTIIPTPTPHIPEPQTVSIPYTFFKNDSTWYSIEPIFEVTIYNITSAPLYRVSSYESNENKQAFYVNVKFKNTAHEMSRNSPNVAFELITNKDNRYKDSVKIPHDFMPGEEMWDKAHFTTWKDEKPKELHIFEYVNNTEYVAYVVNL